MGAVFSVLLSLILKVDVHMQSEYVENNQVFGVSV